MQRLRIHDCFDTTYEDHLFSPWLIETIRSSCRRTTLHLDHMLSFEAFVKPHQLLQVFYWQDLDGAMLGCIELDLKLIFSALHQACHWRFRRWERKSTNVCLPKHRVFSYCWQVVDLLFTFCFGKIPFCKSICIRNIFKININYKN